MKHLFTLILFTLLSNLMIAQVAIISFDLNPDGFSFVALGTIPSGTIINFTDNAILANGSFGSTEGTSSYTVPSGGLTCGQIISGPIGNMALNNTNDQIFAFQGTLGSPTILAGISSNGTITSGKPSAQNTYAPSSSVPFIENIGSESYYTGPNNPILTDLQSASNYTSGNGTPTTIINCSALPVTFSKFLVTAIKNTSILSFATASETNNDFFTIERSADGTSFDAIGEIKGAGNSNTTLSYEFTDKKPFAGVNYYRIKQTDYDGKFSYTDIKSVRHNMYGNLSITPRTTEGRLQITTDAEDYTLDVYNVAGQQVKSYPSLSLDQTISIDELTAGLYYIKVNVGGQVETTKIVKL